MDLFSGHGVLWNVILDNFILGKFGSNFFCNVINDDKWFTDWLILKIPWRTDTKINKVGQH